MGALIGWTVSSDGILRTASIAGATLISLLALGGSTIWWPQLNHTEFAQTEVERAGVEALAKNESARAVRLLEMSTRMKTAPARTWFNLGIAYQQAKDYERALSAYEHAAHMPGADNQMRETAEQMKTYVSRRQEAQ